MTRHGAREETHPKSLAPRDPSNCRRGRGDPRQRTRRGRLACARWPALIPLTRRAGDRRRCGADVSNRGVPGALLETGVWRGGGTIFMGGVLKAYGITDRSVWVADSFQGLPKPDAETFQQDSGDLFWGYDALVVSLEE